MGDDAGSESDWPVCQSDYYAAEHRGDASVLSQTVRWKHSGEVLTLRDGIEPESVAIESVTMTNFEERVLRDLGELKAHMRWIVGNGNEGKIQELEARIQKHEAALQRTAGLGVAAGVLLTIMHLALDSMRAIHH